MLRYLLLALLLVLPVAAADPISDDAIYDRVRIEIAKDREAGGGLIEVKVNQGNVELTGKVKNDKIKERAGKLAKKVKGVKSVDNRIQVAPV